MRRLRNLRIQFALGTAGLLLVVLSGFGVYIYESMARRLAAAVDESLELVAAQVVSGLEFTNNRPAFPEIFSEEPENVDLRQRGYTAWVFTPDGELLAAFGRFQDLGLPPGNPPSMPQFLTMDDAGSSGQVRLHVVTVPGKPGPSAIVRVAKSLEGLPDTLDDLRTTLWVAVPVLVAAAGLGGYLLAARALARIDRITRTAQRISAQDLSARIDLPPTDDEVGRLAMTFDAMLGRLEGSFQRERQFSADASHELLTPLSAIQVILGAIRGKRRTALEYEQALDDLSEEAGRLQTVAADLLHLARLETPSPGPREPVDLSILLNDVADSFRARAEAGRLTLVCEVPMGLSVWGKRDDLIRLFMNLMDNAFKYTERGSISILGEATAADTRVTVADTGIGIPADQISRIFDRLYRVDASRSTSGTGLGLAIARAIVTAHGGTVEVHSVAGNGSTFIVKLPRMR
jgi:signal transduction histidine kinase